MYNTHPYLHSASVHYIPSVTA